LYSQKKSVMQNLLQKDGIQFVRVKRGDVVEGTVVSVSAREALVDLGSKAEGILPFSEVDDLSCLKPGAKILVYVITPEDRRGQLLLSVQRARIINAWAQLEESLTQNQILEAKIKGFNKGGCLVDILGLQGFLPFSLLMSGIDSEDNGEHYQKNLERLKGQTVQVKVVELDPQQRRIIVSERDAFRVARAAEISQLVEKLKVGDLLSVQVKEVLPFGLLVDYQGVEALVPQEELSWQEDDNSLFNFHPGQDLEVKVIELPTDGGGQIKLSLRQVSDDPWLKLKASFDEGREIRGRIKKITSFGLVIEISPGVETLLPLSIAKEREVNLGDELELKIKTLDLASRRLEVEPADLN